MLVEMLGIALAFFMVAALCGFLVHPQRRAEHRMNVTYRLRGRLEPMPWEDD